MRHVGHTRGRNQALTSGACILREEMVKQIKILQFSVINIIVDSSLRERWSWEGWTHSVWEKGPRKKLLSVSC